EIPDVDHALEYFTNTFLTIIDKHAPFKKLRVKDSSSPWLSTELSLLLKERDKAWASARKTAAHWLLFRQLRNKYTYSLRKAKTSNHQELISSCSLNPSKFWKAANINKNKSSPISPFSLFHLIFNLSITTGVVPQVWKSAHIVPLHKGGDKNKLNNYRPISKLSSLSKILETLVNNQLKSFRKKHSTTSAITFVINNIVSAVDQGKYCAALFVDLTKAFDTVDHTILLQRLHDVGFDNSSLKWFQNYLSNRVQCVTVQSDRSEHLPLSKGVPQGSVLGPVLFTSYINNIASVFTICKAHLYADDTVLYCFAETAHLAMETLQEALHKLQNALLDLKLLLNADKTKYMLFT
uniref:Reverse transcriptase domain-containing protein n=1 Tax=Labrus bergylta TaxID=56723 RepID=A0A3Q3GUZ1_9LABR